MPVSVRILRADEGNKLWQVAQGVFDHDLRPEALTDFFADPRHHLAAALDGQLVVGMATGFHYSQPDKQAELFINEVGVADDYQGQGLGTALVNTLLKHAREELGCVAAWVLTEEDNVAARRLYAACGGQEQPGVVMSLFEW